MLLPILGPQGANKNAYKDRNKLGKLFQGPLN
jgi:hypothetical protein